MWRVFVIAGMAWACTGSLAADGGRTSWRGEQAVALATTPLIQDGRALLTFAGPHAVGAIDIRTGKASPLAWSATPGPRVAIAANDRYLAWADAGTGHVTMVDRRSGERILVDRSIKTPRGIAVTGDDQLIVVDADGGRLVRLTTGGSATVASGLRRPVGLFVDGDTDGWVTEYDTGRVSYVNLKTGLVRPLVVALGRPTAVVRLKTGNLAVVEAARGRVLSVDPKTGERTPIAGGLALAVDALDLPPDSVSGLAIAADGTLYVACPGDGSIVAIGPGVQ